MSDVHVPSVAVIIAAYNAGNSVARAVMSAMAEEAVTEIWVIDDQSSDDTLQRVRDCDDGSGRVRLLTQPVNGGPAAARNRALLAAEADWVCVLDADDYFLDGRIRRLLKHVDGVEFVADELIRVDESQPEPGPSSMMDGRSSRLMDLEGFIRGNISQRGQYRQELGFMKPLMRRDFLERHGLVYDTRLRLGEDFHLYARALAHGARLRLVPPQGYVSVVRPDSLSGQHTIDDLQALRDRDIDISAVRTMTAGEASALRDHFTSIDQRLQWRRLIDAVKQRRLALGLSSFTSPKVSWFLVRCLAEQAWLRTVGRVFPA